MSYYTISGHSRFQVKWTEMYTIEPHFLEPHSNPYYELIMVSDGPVHLQVEQEKLTLESGECLLLSPWEQHCGWRRDVKGRFFWVQFSCDPAIEATDKWPETNAEHQLLHISKNDLRISEEHEGESLIIPRRFSPGNRYECLRTFELLVQEFKRPRNYYKFRLTIRLAQLLEQLAQDALEQHNFTAAATASYSTYQKLLSLLHEIYATECSADFIETYMDRKYEYLCQVFKKYAGITIGAYIQQLRLQRAKHLLQYTHKTVDSIALEIGFQDSPYFRKVFKKHEGITPTQYRQEQQTR
ncbi:helix-turn-helix domain-containing protein [Paenibacillus sp. GCM10027626]|uniref:helix-turn-helix domain-containing protein n=1 Tax=Paenibacillus sp. GCM10027626 TaxID=3273411 RepID=UPI0036458AC3